MAPKKAAQKVFVARESGHALIDGREMPFHKDITRVAGDHPLAKHPDFAPADEHFHYETADDIPDTPRDVEIAEPDPAALEYQTVVELREQLKELGGKPSGLSKQELIDAIAAAESEKGDEE